MMYVADTLNAVHLCDAKIVWNEGYLSSTITYQRYKNHQIFLEICSEIRAAQLL